MEENESTKELSQIIGNRESGESAWKIKTRIGKIVKVQLMVVMCFIQNI